MGGSLLGRHLQLMTFGESHGAAMGGVLDGFPAGIPVDYALLRQQLLRRKPMHPDFETPRHEKDEIEILSGVLDGVTLGTPIAFILRNENFKSIEYQSFKNIYRPGHADYTWDKKFGFHDNRGGGRASARETVARVAAGTFARMLLQQHGVLVYGFVSSLGTVTMLEDAIDFSVQAIEQSALRCPDKEVSQRMESLLTKVAKEGDSLGGTITCVVKNCPSGLGEPVFDKLDSALASAIMSIPAIKGVEVGAGFRSSKMKGSELNDPFVYNEGRVVPGKNDAGGILGGISSGADIHLRAALKPVSSIRKKQHTVDNDGAPVDLSVKGRHDVCVVPRAVPIVEAMVCLVLADMLLRQGINSHDAKYL
ncbi:MAG TPA: chorismate synthase [Bacteroidales bacterium]|nr:chorismate synthase [Bacteroidales bacterium]